MEVCEGECMGNSLGDEPLTLMRYQSCGLSQLYEALSRNITGEVRGGAGEEERLKKMEK